MKLKTFIPLGVGLSLFSATAICSQQSASQQLAEQTAQVVNQIELSTGQYLTFNEESQIKLNLMAKQLKQRFPNKDINSLVQQAMIDHQLEDISQQRQLIINLQLLEDDGGGLIPPS